MKSFLLGVITVLLLNFVAKLAQYRGLDTGNQFLIDSGFAVSETLQNRRLVEIVTKRCTNERMDKRGMTLRQWFECNKYQIAISDLLFGKNK